MATLDAQRHLIIRRAVLQKPDAIADRSIDLWERLAAELIAIIGETGFQSLYARSMHLTGAAFPWMLEGTPPVKDNPRFAALKMKLAGRDFNDASEASILLLITLIDILISLIGELLTTSILSAAWGDDALDTAGKEPQ